MEHEYSIDIKIEMTEVLTAKNKKEAVEIVKDIIAEQYGIRIYNDEIKKITKNY